MCTTQKVFHDNTYPTKEQAIIQSKNNSFLHSFTRINSFAVSSKSMQSVLSLCMCKTNAWFNVFWVMDSCKKFIKWCKEENVLSAQPWQKSPEWWEAGVVEFRAGLLHLYLDGGLCILCCRPAKILASSIGYSYRGNPQVLSSIMAQVRCLYIAWFCRLSCFSKCFSIKFMIPKFLVDGNWKTSLSQDWQCINIETWPYRC